MRSARHELIVPGPVTGLGSPSRFGWSVPTDTSFPGRGRVKSAEEIMNILEAYDLTGSFRDAGELAGCSHHTVARYVRAQRRRTARAGRGGAPARGDRRVPAEAGGARRAEQGQGPGRRGAREDHRDGVYGVGAHDPAGGRAAEEGLAFGPAAGVPAVDPGAGDVGAVRLRRRPAGRRGGDGAVLPVAGLVAVPGRAADPGQDPGRRSGLRSTWRCAGPAGCRPTC